MAGEKQHINISLHVFTIQSLLLELCVSTLRARNQSLADSDLVHSTEQIL